MSGPLALVAMLATVGAATAAIPGPPSTATPLEGGGLWVPGSADHPSVLVLAPDANGSLLDSLLAHRITSVDVVVATAGNARAARLVRSIDEVAPAGVILAPPLHRVLNARTVRQPVTVRSAVPLKITPVAVPRRPGRLEVELIQPAATDPAPAGQDSPAPP